MNNIRVNTNRIRNVVVENTSNRATKWVAKQSDLGHWSTESAVRDRRVRSKVDGSPSEFSITTVMNKTHRSLVGHVTKLYNYDHGPLSGAPGNT